MLERSGMAWDVVTFESNKRVRKSRKRIRRMIAGNLDHQKYQRVGFLPDRALTTSR